MGDGSNVRSVTARAILGVAVLLTLACAPPDDPHTAPIYPSWVTVDRRDSEGPAEPSGRGPSGAMQALDYWGAQRAYPGKTLPESSYGVALERSRAMRARRSAALEEVVTPWRPIGPTNVGGRTLCLGDIANYSSSSVYDLEEAFLSADDEGLEDIVTQTSRERVAQGPVWLRDAISLFYAMIATLLLMLPVSWVYKSIHTDSIYDHSIDTTTLVLPAVVAGIVTVVQHSLALAFSLESA